MGSVSDPSAGRSRSGRPPTISRAAIAEAVAAMPAEQVSMRAVANALGVSISSLYHWVSGRQEMLRLGGEHSLNRLEPPRDHGQHWAVWLYEWAAHVYRAFSTEPALLRQFADGSLDLPRMVETVETALGLLVREGFAEEEAARAFQLVSETAVGAAVGTIRATRMQVDGPAVGSDLHRAVSTIVTGIAVRRGDDWREVLHTLDRALP